MNKLETARRLARQTAGQGQNTEKEKQEDPQIIDLIAKILELVMDSQKVLNRNQQALVDGVKKKLTPLDNLEKRMPAMENTIMKLVKQQEKMRRLLMAIFFMGTIPLLALITALVLKIWILK